MHIACIYFRKILYHPKEIVYDKKRDFIIPMGISYIASSLKVAGYETEVLFYELQRDKIYNKITGIDKLVLLSVTTEVDYERAKNVIENIKKKYPKIKVGVGGPYPTLVPEDMMANKDIDMVCIGEGEIANVEYAKQVEKEQYHKTDNLWIRDNNGEIIKCDRSVVIEDIDSLPYPDRDGWTNSISENFKQKQINQYILLERGCNNKCTYCVHHALSKKQEGKYLRHRNIDKVIEEIEYICIRYPYTKVIRFVADNALSNPKYFIELCQKLIKFNEKRGKKIRFHFSLNISREALKYKEEIVSLMKKANVVAFNIGLQSVSLDIRKKLCRPYYTNEELEEFIYITKSAGIISTIDILWHPYLYTKQIYKETFRYLKKIQPFNVAIYWLIPTKGTELYKDKDKIVSYENAKLIDKLRFKMLKYRWLYEYKKVYFKQYIKTKIENIKTKIRGKKQQRYISKAKLCIDNKKYKKAIKYFNKISIDKTNYWIYGDRGIAKMSIGDYKGAIKDFDKILDLEPKDIYKEKREECLDLLNKTK